MAEETDMVLMGRGRDKRLTPIVPQKKVEKKSFSPLLQTEEGDSLPAPGPGSLPPVAGEEQNLLLFGALQ